MSDVGEMYAEFKKQRKEKKWSNLERSTQLLIDNGVSFESKNLGIHLVVQGKDSVIDFWPSTGKFKARNESKYYRGVRNLLKRC